MNQQVKILFRLIKDNDGYPPREWESMWAVPLGGGCYRLDSIPFYAVGISSEDVVAATNVDGELLFERLVEEGGHTTVRLLCWNDADVEPVRAALRDLGCASELSDIRGLIAVDVPPAVDYKRVREFLINGTDTDRWDVEESCLAHAAATRP